MPAANIPAMETPMSEPYMIIRLDGGIVGPMIEPAIVTAHEKGRV